MKSSELKDTFLDELHNTNFDLKAEILISALKNDTKYSVLFSDFFSRRFSKDIVDIDYDPKIKDQLNIHLSRSGFYDYFPESFFHRPVKVHPDATHMAKNYKARKKEEAHTRKFFHPLENEFFNFNLLIDDEEVSIFESINNSGLADVLKGLWNIDKSFDSKMATKLLKAMPFLNKISGKVHQCVDILKSIIGEDIDVEIVPLVLKDQDGVGNYVLGENFATHFNKKTFLKNYIITVKNIKNPNLFEYYLPNGKIYNIIKFFMDYTIPLEAEYEINFTVDNKFNTFELDENIYSSRLNVTTTI